MREEVSELDPRGLDSDRIQQCGSVEAEPRMVARVHDGMLGHGASKDGRQERGQSAASGVTLDLFPQEIIGGTDERDHGMRRMQGAEQGTMAARRMVQGGIGQRPEQDGEGRRVLSEVPHEGFASNAGRGARSEAARVDPRMKCRRAGCGLRMAAHANGGACGAFLGRDDIAKTPRKPAGVAEQAYAAAYGRGIRRAAPSQAWAMTGQKVGALLGAAAREHARSGGEPLTGDALLKWFEEQAYAFRMATAEDAVYWGGWQPYNFVRWLNMRAAGAKPGVRKASGLQPGRAKKFGA
jgi:hypothetical protein